MRDEAALRAKFEEFDTDGNGYIDQAEFTALIRKLGLKLTDTKASIAFLALDVNGNGRIEFGEFCVWWLKFDRP